MNPIAFGGAIWALDLSDLRIVALPFLEAFAIILGGLVAFLASKPLDLNKRAQSMSDLVTEDEGMTAIMRENSRLLGIDPIPIVSLGGSDLKFWRSKGIPSYYYGPMNHGMGTVNEYVEVEEFIHIVKVHLLSAYEYLTR